MPVETTFNLAGVTRCPELKPGFLEPGDARLKFMDGSECFLGMPAVTFTWPKLPLEEAQLIWQAYDDMVTEVDPNSAIANPIAVTIPDYKGGGWRTTTAYLTRPGGTARGDFVEGFSVTLYNLHEQSLLDAMESPGGDMWVYMRQGANLQIGGAQYGATGWQF
jgi:hypothetical protein